MRITWTVGCEPQTPPFLALSLSQTVVATKTDTTRGSTHIDYILEHPARARVHPLYPPYLPARYQDGLYTTADAYIYICYEYSTIALCTYT